ncbi:L,D-transpeptidase family protein [Aedoeadaptatus pacaensis]|uniref:L,D-transpeptidase family protein n=1 Tax=Aedoeadaptatus pacaensis TaxID=1776390 RepID=UPI00083805B4|nr:L,D-transpeptidase family protein [Peptoniphilus pacaensis]
MSNRFGKIAAIVLGILAVIYILGGILFTQVYMPKTSVNGADISLQPKADLKENFKKSWKDYALTVVGKDEKTDTIKASTIDYVETMPDFKIKEYSSWGWPVYAFTEKDYKVKTNISYDDAKLETALAYMHMVADKDITDPTPQMIVYKEGEGYSIADAKEGTRLDGPKLKKAVLDSFHKQDKELDAKKADLYLKAAPAEDLDHMKKHVASLNTIEGYKLTYNFSDREEVLAGEPLINLYKSAEDGSLEPDEEKVKAYVAGLGEKYDTFKGTRDFQATGGAMMRVVGGIYGWQIDRPKTVEQLMTAMNDMKTQTMEPVYKRRARSRNVNDIGNSYIEIDIARQHMWLYKEGNLVIDTPVVTGNPYAGNSTPTGTHEVWMMERNRYLTGDTWKSYVKYWMPFNWTGCGIHDSSWRGSYGGNIYRGGGSHGCVNTPPSKAPTFYENAFIGMPVIVYNSNKHAI